MKKVLSRYNIHNSESIFHFLQVVVVVGFSPVEEVERLLMVP